MTSVFTKNVQKSSGLSMVSELLDLSSFKPVQKSYEVSLLTELHEALTAMNIDDIPDELALEYSIDILSAYKSQQKCANCHNQLEQAVSCHRLLVTYNAVTQKIHVDATICPYKKQVAAQKLAKDEMKDLLVSPKFRSRTFDNFQPSAQSRKLLDFCQNWSEHYDKVPKGLFIFGGYGSGKTHLAVASMFAVWRNCHTGCMFVVVSEYLSKLKKYFNDPAGLERQMKLYKEIPLLLLDDLGEGRKEKTGMLSEWAREQLFNLINYRYEHEHLMIITSAYNPSQLAEVTGAAIVSRLAEMCYFLHNKDGDHRMNNCVVIE